MFRQCFCRTATAKHLEDARSVSVVLSRLNAVLDLIADHLDGILFLQKPFDYPELSLDGALAGVLLASFGLSHVSSSPA